jgi:glycosyltransferase involved in cell wall biosynthesis
MSEISTSRVPQTTGPIVFLIPAYQPSEGLSSLLERIRREDSSHFVVVDDGSGPDYEAVFREVAKVAGTSVLRNAVNLGKGAALKHGMNHILVNFPDCAGVVTADADGQHSPADIMRISGLLKANPDSVIFGEREFDSAVPLRSKLGNVISRYVYRLFIGLNLSDTQTGLRGIPRSLMVKCLSIRANRYEFETEQLLVIKSTRTPLLQVRIETIYIDDNRASHFRPLLDSVQIYFVLLRYVASSLLTEGADLVVFASVMAWSDNLLLANVIGRLIAIWVQFTLLQTFVFRLRGNARMFLAYIALVVVSGMLSTALQLQFAHFIAAAVPAKIAAEVLVFVFNFLFLRDFVFGEWGHAARD